MLLALPLALTLLRSRFSDVYRSVFSVAVAAAVEVYYLRPVALATKAFSWVPLVQNCRFHGHQMNLLEAVLHHLPVVAVAW